MKNRHKYCDAEGRFRGIGVTRSRTFIHLAIGRSKGTEGGTQSLQRSGGNLLVPCVCNISSEKGGYPYLWAKHFANPTNRHTHTSSIQKNANLTFEAHR